MSKNPEYGGPRGAGTTISCIQASRNLLHVVFPAEGGEHNGQFMDGLPLRAEASAGFSARAAADAFYQRFPESISEQQKLI